MKYKQVRVLSTDISEIIRLLKEHEKPVFCTLKGNVITSDDEENETFMRIEGISKIEYYERKARRLKGMADLEKIKETFINKILN